MIVTFKKKDERGDPTTDKVALLSDRIERPVAALDVGTLARGQPLPPAVVEFDVNLYDAPIVVASLTQAEADALRDDTNNVVAVEEDGFVYAAGEAPLQDPLLVEGQPEPAAETIPWGVSRVKAPLAWDATRAKTIRAAVLDTGIDYKHPDLCANYRGGISFVEDETDPMDYNSHGTHCAGTIAARINGAGVVGVAPAAYLYAVKVLSRGGSGRWSWLIAGIGWCVENKMDVLSMSLSAATAPSAVELACDTAWKSGSVLVAAAGNAAGPVHPPAAFGSVIAVSAINRENILAGFSCRGPEVELCAPGVEVLSTIPQGGYGTKSGTSMACPHVSGAAALAIGSHRWPREGPPANVAIRRLLAWTADNLGVPGRDDEFGFGLVDAEQVACERALPPEMEGIP